MKSAVIIGPKRALLYQQDSLSLFVSAQVDPDAISLLKQTTYGTEGIRYRQTGQEDKLYQLHNPRFFQLYIRQILIGFYCLDQRPVGFPSASFSGYYGRYLAVKDDYQGKGFGQLLKSTAINYLTQSAPLPHLFYSFIEEKNTRSMKASLKDSFVSVAQFKTYMFRRFSPKVDSRFHIASLVDPAKALRLVQRQFAHYGFQNFINISYQNHYFTLEENGQVLAGVQANPIIWKLVQIPGMLGPIIRYVVPAVPGLRRFFNPSRQSFVVLEGVYVDKNRPDMLPILLESVLAHFKIHTAMWQIDEKDPMMELIKGQKMGMLSQFQPGVTTHLMVKAVGFPATAELSKYPAYMSCFDYS